MKQEARKNPYTIEQEARKQEKEFSAIVNYMFASGKAEAEKAEQEKEYCAASLRLLIGKEAKKEAEAKAAKAEAAFSKAIAKYEEAQAEAQAASIEKAIAKYASRKSKSASTEKQIEAYASRKEAEAEAEEAEAKAEAAFASMKKSLAEYKAAYEEAEKMFRAEKEAFYGFLFASVFASRNETEAQAIAKARSAKAFFTKAEAKAEAEKAARKEAEAKAASSVLAMIEAQEAEAEKAKAEQEAEAEEEAHFAYNSEAEKMLFAAIAKAEAQADYEAKKRIEAEKGKANYIRISDIASILEGKAAKDFSALSEAELLKCLQAFFNLYKHIFLKGNTKKAEAEAARSAKEAACNAEEAQAVLEAENVKLYHYKENVSVFDRFCIEYEQEIKNTCVLCMLEKYAKREISLHAAFACAMKNAFGKVFDFAFSQSKFSAIAYNEMIACGRDISDIEAEEKYSLIELQAAIENCIAEYAKQGKKQEKAASRLHDVYIFYGLLQETQEAIAKMLHCKQEAIARDIKTLRNICGSILANR